MVEHVAAIAGWRCAIDFFEEGEVDGSALKALARAAVEFNRAPNAGRKSGG
jgi:hypothetical protein